MPIRAKQMIRKMRGGAQAHLLEGENGAFYVVKFTNNPQHRRILVNEWLAYALLRHLQIHVPETALIELSPEFLGDAPDLYLTIGPKRESVPAGIHFGSRLAVHPERVAIFDFLPDKLLGKVENRADFLGTLLFDKWAGNTDSRQAIFFRAKAKTWTPVRDPTPARIGFFAQMIDHGFCFNGPHWEFADSPLQGIYFRTAIYETVHSLDSFQPWLEMIENFPAEVIDAALKEIPAQWIGEDADELERLLEKLMKRRKEIRRLLDDTRSKRSNAFANWR